jgi:hypothetical protein
MTIKATMKKVSIPIEQSSSNALFLSSTPESGKYLSFVTVSIHRGNFAKKHLERKKKLFQIKSQRTLLSPPFSLSLLPPSPFLSLSLSRSLFFLSPSLSLPPQTLLCEFVCCCFLISSQGRKVGIYYFRHPKMHQSVHLTHF